MKEFWELLQSHKISPTCLGCGSYFRKEAFFCLLCFRQISDKYQTFENTSDLVESLDLTTHYQWVPGASDSLSKTIHLLKMLESKSAWRFLGKLFSDELLKNQVKELNSTNTVLVPVPGRKNSSVHTDYFSEVLSENLQLKTVHLLRSQSPLSVVSPGALQQKRLSRRQRLSREFNFYVDFTRAGEIEKTQNIVLIDDVVTTGATLQACKRQLKALKPSLKISAWVMFRRL